jgi:5-methylcytosine-specific restriction endonuclease McrA
MGKRQREWARLWKDRLRDLLGRRCACCGALNDLEFDIIHPIGHGHARTDQSTRVIFYRRQFFARNLQLLCKDCNTIKGRKELSLPVLLSMVNKARNNGTLAPAPAYEDETSEQVCEQAEELPF